MIRIRSLRVMLHIYRRSVFYMFQVKYFWEIKWQYERLVYLLIRDTFSHINKEPYSLFNQNSSIRWSIYVFSDYMTFYKISRSGRSKIFCWFKKKSTKISKIYHLALLKLKLQIILLFKVALYCSGVSGRSQCVEPN